MNAAQKDRIDKLTRRLVFAGFTAETARDMAFAAADHFTSNTVTTPYQETAVGITITIPQDVF